MALVNDHQHHHQTPSRSTFYVDMFEVESSVEFKHLSPYEFHDQYDQDRNGDDHNLDSPNSNINIINSNVNQVISNSPTISSSSSANSSNNNNNNGFTTIHHHDPSSMNFKPAYYRSLLSFEPENYQKQSEEVSHHLRSSSSDYQDSTNEWFYNADANVAYPSEEFVKPQQCVKRPYMEEENIQLSPKKRCAITNVAKKPTKAKSSSTSKDPQSLVAKNRRERISEKLKILQELIPNGSKVDLVTMLEKAISYVKFLQLQMKVLATDEFWPTAGGKAPDISQVRQAIDAILSSQRSGA